MRRVTVRNSVVYAVACVLVCVVAAWSGDLLGKRLGGIREKRAFKRQIEDSLRGIEIGKPFPPEVVLWSDDGVTARHVRDIGFADGILFFLESESGPYCEATIDTLAQIARLKGEEIRDLWFVVDEDPTPVLSYMRSYQLDKPVLWDVEHVLTEQYGVPIRRVYFDFDAAGRIHDYGPFFTHYDELLRLVRRDAPKAEERKE